MKIESFAKRKKRISVKEDPWSCSMIEDEQRCNDLRWCNQVWTSDSASDDDASFINPGHESERERERERNRELETLKGIFFAWLSSSSFSSYSKTVSINETAINGFFTRSRGNCSTLTFFFFSVSARAILVNRRCSCEHVSNGLTTQLHGNGSWRGKVKRERWMLVSRCWW